MNWRMRRQKIAEKLLTLEVLTTGATEDVIKINSKKPPSPPNSQGTITAFPMRKKEMTINDYVFCARLKHLLLLKGFFICFHCT